MGKIPDGHCSDGHSTLWAFFLMDILHGFVNLAYVHLTLTLMVMGSNPTYNSQRTFPDMILTTEGNAKFKIKVLKKIISVGP